MEKDILNIINSNNKDNNYKKKDKDISIFLNDFEKIEKERIEKANYSNEVSKLVKTC